MSLDDPAGQLRSAAAELTAAAAALSGASALSSAVGAGAFGSGATGRLGELGRDLHRGYVAALEARAREAVAHGARLSAAADAVGRAAADYAQADEVGAGRHREAT